MTMCAKSAVLSHMYHQTAVNISAHPGRLTMAKRIHVKTCGFSLNYSLITYRRKWTGKPLETPHPPGSLTSAVRTM